MTLAKSWRGSCADHSLEYIYITGTKLASDPVVGASVTGHVGCKAQLVKQIGACVYIDDQQQLLNEAAEAQANRAYKPTHKLT